MIPTLRILMNMGSLQRLAPVWLLGVFALVNWFSIWLVVAAPVFVSSRTANRSAEIQ